MPQSDRHLIGLLKPVGGADVQLDEMLGCRHPQLGDKCGPDQRVDLAPADWPNPYHERPSLLRMREVRPRRTPTGQ